MAEWSIAAVLKTVDCNRSGGSNPSLSAKMNRNNLVNRLLRFFCNKQNRDEYLENGEKFSFFNLTLRMAFIFILTQ